MKGKTGQAGLAMDIFELIHLANFRMPNSPIMRQVEKLTFPSLGWRTVLIHFTFSSTRIQDGVSNIAISYKKASSSPLWICV